MTIAMPIKATAVNTGCRLMVPEGVMENMVHPASPTMDTIAPAATMIRLLILTGTFGMFFTAFCLVTRRRDGNVREGSVMCE
jgi:hypothetical protein